MVQSFPCSSVASPSHASVWVLFFAFFPQSFVVMGSIKPPGVMPKRLIVCCDGTWENALGADSQKPQTNVTRISRSLVSLCTDGTSQIIYYHPGVGTGGSLDAILGGVFGMGLGAVRFLTWCSTLPHRH